MKNVLYICIGALFAVLAFSSCNDGIDIRQGYDFSLSSWYLQKQIATGETVEIRFYLEKQGGSPVDRLEAAQNGKSDTETGIPALVRQYGNKIAEFPRELRFGYYLIFVGVLLYLIIQTIQPQYLGYIVRH